ncbi:MAG: hypothetical protein M3Q61_05000 [Chloroflexota bacterium]|nr:hypothetical protein [Chloroflexota bacterium]
MSARVFQRIVAGAAYGAVVLLFLLFLWYAWIPLLILGGVIAYLELTRLVWRAFDRPVRLVVLLVGGLYIAGGLAALAQLQLPGPGRSVRSSRPSGDGRSSRSR